MIKPQDLSGAARESFDMWRSLGLSEAASLNAVREDGLLPTSEHDHLLDLFRTLGLSESAAATAARGRNPVRPAGFAGVVEMFKGLGLSESAARTAAIGRDASLSEARDFWSGGGGRNDIRDPGLRLAQEALDNMTDAECDAMWAEEQKRRRKPAAKASVKQPAGKRPTVVSETTYPRGRR